MENNREIIFCGSEYFVDKSLDNKIVITGNLLLTDNSKYIPYNYFLDYPPFINGFDNSKLDLIHGFKLDKKIKL